MLLILAGNVIAAFGSFNSQELIVKGEIFQLQNIVTKNYFSNIPENYIRINDFWIEYGEKNHIEQFYSNLSILDKHGIEKIQKTINVNLEEHNENVDYKKTPLPKLRSIVEEKGLVKDASKLKKNELLKLLEVE
jgi:hypothetical protein